MQTFGWRGRAGQGWWWLVAFALSLIAPPLARANPGEDKAFGVAEAPADAKYQVTLDDNTSWQPYGGSVRFAVRGPDLQSNPPRVTASIDWKMERTSSAPATAGRSATAVALIPVRVGETTDRLGILFSVTVPLAWKDRPPGVATTFCVIPAAELRVEVYEAPKAAGAQPTVNQTGLEIGITAKVIAGAWALSFVVLASLILYRFARRLGVPGTGVVLRLVSSANGWASLAQFQIVLWTILISAGAVYVMTLTGSLIEITSGTLVILGIAGGAAVGSQIKTSQQTGSSGPSASPPGPVRSVLPGAPRADEVVLSWSPPIVGDKPTKYVVQFRPAAGAGDENDETTWIVATTAVTEPRFRLVNLRPSTRYQVRVRAANPAGLGDAALSEPFPTDAATPPPIGAPAAVTDFDEAKGAPRMPDAIQLAWTATACVQYTIEYRKHDSDENWSIHLPPQPGRATVKDLRADTNYDFRISAQKGALNGPPSNILQIPTAARVPRWEDLVTDTDRRPDVDVSRVQMLLFTVVSAIFVALKIIDSSTIPEIPDSYVTLMGISNGVYLTAKFAPH
jgi:Fibronectin type III domain